MEQQETKLEVPFGSLVMRYQHANPTWSQAINGQSKLEYDIKYDGVYLVGAEGIPVKLKAFVLEDGETVNL